MREGAMVESALTMAGSAGAGATGLPYRMKSGWAEQTVGTNTRHKNSPILGNVIVSSPPAKVVLLRRRLPLDRRLQSISNYEYHPNLTESYRKGTSSQHVNMKHRLERERRQPMPSCAECEKDLA